jgi:hypothetical protein
LRGPGTYHDKTVVLEPDLVHVQQVEMAEAQPQKGRAALPVDGVVRGVVRFVDVWTM